MGRTVTDSLRTACRQQPRVSNAQLWCAAECTRLKLAQPTALVHLRTVPPTLCSMLLPDPRSRKKPPTFLRIFLGELGSPPRCWLTGGSRDQPHSCFSSSQSLHRCQRGAYEEHSYGQQCRTLLLLTLACLAERHPVQVCPSKGSSAEAVCLLCHVPEACVDFVNTASTSAWSSVCCSQSGSAASLGPALQCDGTAEYQAKAAGLPHHQASFAVS